MGTRCISLSLCTVPFLPYSGIGLGTPAYLSCSALSFCRQLLYSRFSAIMVVFLFPVVLGTPTDSALHLTATMASADFCTFSTPLRAWLLLSERPVQTSPGTTRFFPSIYLPHLPPPVPCSYWTSTCMAALSPAIALYAVSVRQARGLPAPSFRFHLAMDTLGVRLYPSRYRADSGLSPVRNVRRRAHQTKRLPGKCSEALIFLWCRRPDLNRHVVAYGRF